MSIYYPQGCTPWVITVLYFTQKAVHYSTTKTKEQPIGGAIHNAWIRPGFIATVLGSEWSLIQLELLPISSMLLNFVYFKRLTKELDPP